MSERGRSPVPLKWRNCNAEKRGAVDLRWIHAEIVFFQSPSLRVVLCIRRIATKVFWCGKSDVFTTYLYYCVIVTRPTNDVNRWVQTFFRSHSLHLFQNRHQRKDTLDTPERIWLSVRWVLLKATPVFGVSQLGKLGMDKKNQPRLSWSINDPAWRSSWEPRADRRWASPWPPSIGFHSHGIPQQLDDIYNGQFH